MTIHDPAGERVVCALVRLALPSLAEERRDAQVLERFGFSRAESGELVRAGVLAGGP